MIFKMIIGMNSEHGSVLLRSFSRWCQDDDATMHPSDDGTMAELVAMTVRLELVSHHLYDEGSDTP